MSYNKGMVATLAELEDFYRGQAAGDMIELMNQTNDILTDIKWMEANMSDGHRTRIRTGLPEVYWRRLYRGTPPSKSQWAQVKEACAILETSAVLDVEELNLYGDKAAKFRLSEGKAFTEALRQKVAHTIFYGDSNVRPDEFNGLVMRYSGKNAPHVLDGGAVAADAGKCTSMWLVAWGEDCAHGIYPKGSSGGLRKKSVAEYPAHDNEGNEFQAVKDIYSWHCGLAVRDWRAVVRIGGLKVENLAKRKGQSGFIDLQALTIMAKNMMPEHMRQKAIWYCNQDVLNGIELQATDAGNVHLVYGEYFKSGPVPALHGRPIRQCDAIASTENPLA